ncbi:tetratricopeptide repeat protein [Kitasatospora sp. NPDC058170]|uniref:tetratricopeptide repeat protein n=1 Tax=Kitasatospora sp. NPDC058170 TaxID=3346364 RepID=UPI0036DCFCEF
MEERRRLAVVEAAGQGSGYVLAPRLVLTAQHVLGNHKHATVRTPRGKPTRSQVIWARSDSPYDAALLLADEDLVCDLAPVRWGRLVASDQTDISVLGFTALAGREGRIGSAAFRGSLDPLEAVEIDRYVLALEGSPPLGSAHASPWAGLSGGAVWCLGTLVGVAVADLPGWPHSRLEAVPSYVLLADDEFRELIGQHTGTAVHLEPAELADSVEAVVPLVPRSVATLLHPRAETVRFSGRRELLHEMVAWSTSGNDLSVALLTGCGGAGKTRVARELGHQLAALGFAVVNLSRRSSQEQHRLLARATAPVLLVIDYAESRVDKLGVLLDHLSSRPHTAPFKVLLIARAVGQWWDDVRSDSRPETVDVTGRARRWSIPDTASLGVDEAQAFHAAVDDLTRGAAALGLAVAAPRGGASVPHRVFAGRPPRTVLEIHMAALASILTPYAPSEVKNAQETLLLHEAAYWRETSRRAPLDGLGDAALRNAVVVATLVGPVSSSRAREILCRVPRIGDHPESVRWAVADWLSDLYPRPEDFDGGPWQWGPLEPDPLGEYLVGTRVAAEPEIFLRLLEVLNEEESVNSLLVLSRAAVHVEAEPLEKVLQAAVRAFPALLASRLVAAGIRSAEPTILIATLDRILVEELLPPDQLQELAVQIPVLTQALASWSVRMQQLLAEVVDEQSSATPEVQRATSQYNLALRLMAALRYDEALDVVTSALGVLDTAPTAQPLLQGLLLNQRGAALGRLGHVEEAVRESRKSVAMVISWQPKSTADRLFFLAGVLNNLSHNLADAGDLDEALEAARASVGMRRELVTRDPLVQPDLARSLNTLTLRHYQAGNLTEALEAAQESLHLRRAVAQDHPDAYLDELASTLSNKARVLQRLGDLSGAREALAEVASIKRRLARSNPTIQQVDYVLTMHELAKLNAEMGATADAVAIADEAVGLARELVTAHGRDYLPLLGGSFLVQSLALTAASCGQVAYRVNNKAAQVFRAVLHEDPSDVSGLLSALCNQGQFLSHMKRNEDAEHSAAEAVAILAGLPEELREELSEECAAAYARHAKTLLALGRSREFREARDAALSLYQRLEQDTPGSFIGDIADVNRFESPDG